MKNFYPNLPVIAYQRTPVDMQDVIEYISSLTCSTEIKRMTYVIFRNESGNGKNVFNGNGIGLQSDAGLWPSKYNQYFIGTVDQTDSTHAYRGFLVLKSWKNSIDILVDEIYNRGMYIGGIVHIQDEVIHVVDELTIVQAYEQVWVYGSKNYKITSIDIRDVESMYNEAIILFQ